MFVIDAHTHLGLQQFLVKPISEEKRAKPAFKDTMENPWETLISAMDRNGVQQAVSFPYPLAEVDSDRANDYVFQAWESYPDRIIPFALIGDDAVKWIARGARGFKQHFLLEPQRFDLEAIYPVIAKAGLPLIAHLETGAIVRGVEAILAIAPTLQVIVAHMGRCEPNTGLGVAENLDALVHYPNVFFETSTVRDPDVFRLAVRKVGPERICFGSDFPFNSHLNADPLATELQLMHSAGLSQPDLRKMMASNILELTRGHL
jgi:predicted TIM-barrel fold metal-dependent hydrolase